jgi:hypothetical protein
MGGIVGTVISAGASLIGGAMSSRSARKAADTQSDAARYAADLQYKQYQEQQKLQAPFREAGLTAQNRLLDYLGLSPGVKGKYSGDFGMRDFQADPGYAFRLSEGTRALDRTAAARGGLLSGSTLRGAQRFGQDLASQEYQNAFNRYQVNRSNQLNPLQSLLGSGQSATNVLGTAGQNYATQAGENYMGAANARASGYVGSANALSNAFGGVSNAFTNYNLMNTLNRPAYTPSTGGYSSGGGVNAFL